MWNNTSLFLALALGFNTALAQPMNTTTAADPWGHPGYAVQQPAPDEVIRNGIDRLTRFLATPEATSNDRIRVFIEREIAPHFDFSAMGKWAAGPYYRRLNPKQRQHLYAALREMFLTALARNLGTYARPLPRIDVYPASHGRWAEEAVVRARVSTPGGFPPVRLDFRMYQTSAGWKVFDVTANASSAVAYYRNYFNQMLQRHGPQALLR